MKTLTSTLFLLTIACNLSFSQQWTNYTNDRLIADILVDGDDVWVGSQGGLTRTNLVTGEFQTYLAANSPIVGGGISEIAKAPDGSLWFGSENGGIFHVKDGEWKHYYDGIVEDDYNTINNLQVLPNNDAWFFIALGGNNSEHRLARIRDGELELFDNLPERQYAFYAADEHTIYIVNETFVYQYDVDAKAVVQTWSPSNSIISPDDHIRDILADKHGDLVLSSTTRMLKLSNGTISEAYTIGLYVNRSFTDDEGNIYFQPPHNDPNAIRLMKYDGNAFTIMRDNNLTPYPATNKPIFNAGDSKYGLFATVFNVDSEYTLYRHHNNTWYPVRSQIVPLLDHYQEDVQADCEGNLWFASYNGIDVKYADDTWEHFPVETLQSTYFSMREMAVHPYTCDVYFSNGSNSGHPIIPGIIKISNGEVTEFLHNHDNVLALEAAVDGKIYFWSADSGFGYIEGDVVHDIDHQGTFDHAFEMDSDTEGNIYLATWDTGLVKYDGANCITLGAGPGNEYVFDVYVDRDDLVWVVSDNGLMLYDGLAWHDENSQWVNEVITDMVQDEHGKYWVATANAGLFYWDREVKQQYTILNSGLTTNILYGVELGQKGNLIVTQLVGASVLEISSALAGFKGTGTVFYDDNQDGEYDGGADILVPGQKVKDTSRNVWSVTNPGGVYSFYTEDEGDYAYLYQPPTGSTITTPNPQQATLNAQQHDLPDFGFWKEYEPCITMTIINSAVVCDRELNLHVRLQNCSIHPIHGSLTFDYNQLFEFIESTYPVTIHNPGQLIFTNIYLGPLEGITIGITFNAPGNQGLGTTFVFDAEFDTTDFPFTDSTTDTLRCSYDPNDKKVEPTGAYYEDYSLIQDPLQYTIRFQNEGTYKAFDIVIIDTLDSNLDPATFEFLASSHAVETTISEEGIVTFVFRNIDLPTRDEDEAGSQGYVTFTIKPDAGVADYTRIFNKASIYFDFNPPIVTNNTAWNLVHDLAIVSTESIEREMSIAPNPSHGSVIVTLDFNAAYKVLNTIGQQVAAGDFHAGPNAVHLDVLPGVYYLQVADWEGKGMIEKLVVID